MTITLEVLFQKGKDFVVVISPSELKKLQEIGVKLRVVGGRKIGTYGKTAVRSLPNKRTSDNLRAKKRLKA